MSLLQIYCLRVQNQTSGAGGGQEENKEGYNLLLRKSKKAQMKVGRWTASGTGSECRERLTWRRQMRRESITFPVGWSQLYVSVLSGNKDHFLMSNQKGLDRCTMWLKIKNNNHYCVSIFCLGKIKHTQNIKTHVINIKYPHTEFPFQSYCCEFKKLILQPWYWRKVFQVYFFLSYWCYDIYYYRL